MTSTAEGSDEHNARSRAKRQDKFRSVLLEAERLLCNRLATSEVSTTKSRDERGTKGQGRVMDDKGKEDERLREIGVCVAVRCTGANILCVGVRTVCDEEGAELRRELEPRYFILYVI